jgi:long-chain acyl-CoA synthetase
MIANGYRGLSTEERKVNNAPMNLGDLLNSAAVRTPSKTALIFGSESLSYKALDQSATLLAQWFLQSGLRKGDRVAIHRSNSFQTVQLFFACFRAGLIAVPINTRLKAAEIAYILDHSKAMMCFSQPELESIAREAATECSSLHLHTQVPELSEAGMPGLPDVDADEPALIIYTSGTTARPKGVTHTHRTLICTAEGMASVGVDGSQTVLVLTTMMHASGLYCDLLPTILGGTTAVLAPAFEPGVVLDLIERHRCSFTVGLPTLIHDLAEEQARRPRDVSSMRLFYGGGDAVPASLQERFQALFGIPLLESFGMTECIAICRSNAVEGIRTGSIGRPAEGIEVRAADATGKTVPENETGEMAVRSARNFVGYWENPEATAETLRDGWLYTGDLVRCDSDGYFWFMGRKKEIIIRCGSNISPQEVEDALYQHPAVIQTGVIGKPHPIYGEQVVAFVSLREGQEISEQQLMEFARKRLADYKTPERILFLPDLPKGPTGKVQRRALKEIAI